LQLLCVKGLVFDDSTGSCDADGTLDNNESGLLTITRHNAVHSAISLIVSLLGVAGLYRVKYLRVTQPWMNIVLLGLAIPAVLTHDPKRLKRAASKCLTLSGLAMGSVFICQQMANNPPPGSFWVANWPLLMSWMPIFIFAPVAVYLLDRVPS